MMDMDTQNTDKALSFEKALFIALSRHGFLLPVDDDQVVKFENELPATQTIPDEFSDPQALIPREVDNLRTMITDQFDTDGLYNWKVASSQDENRNEGED